MPEKRDPAAMAGGSGWSRREGVEQTSFGEPNAQAFKQILDRRAKAMQNLPRRRTACTGSDW